jgi:hypothetical protein
MTNEEQLLAALEYQRAMRPAFGNPNLMRQGARMNLPARQAPGLFSEFGTQAMSLDPQPNQGYGTMAAEMALGFVPGVGQAMAARDIERARRDNDPLGMALAGLSLLPLGKLIGSLRGGKQMGPVSDVVFPGVESMPNMKPTVTVKAKTGYVPENIADQKINNPASAWRNSDLLQFANKNATSAFVRGNLDISIKELSDGRLLLEHSPMWGSIAKPFYIVGNDVDELVSLAIPRLEKSNRSVEAAKKSKFDNSLLGKLTAEYGDTFSISKSGRSESSYITHEPSGTKIRISGHNLPLGYVQPDVDLRIGQSLDEQLAEIRKVLGQEDIMKQTVPEPSLMYKDPFGGIE